ncbi:MAG: hypothetical protein MHM6MM_008096, partial [Cercozoa sp. M6MM]
MLSGLPVDEEERHRWHVAQQKFLVILKRRDAEIARLRAQVNRDSDNVTNLRVNVKCNDSERRSHSSFSSGESEDRTRDTEDFQTQLKSDKKTRNGEAEVRTKPSKSNSELQQLRLVESEQRKLISTLIDEVRRLQKQAEPGENPASADKEKAEAKSETNRRQGEATKDVDIKVQHKSMEEVRSSRRSDRKRLSVSVPLVARQRSRRSVSSAGTGRKRMLSSTAVQVGDPYFQQLTIEQCESVDSATQTTHRIKVRHTRSPDRSKSVTVATTTNLDCATLDDAAEKLNEYRRRCSDLATRANHERERARSYRKLNTKLESQMKRRDDKFRSMQARCDTLKHEQSRTMR